MSEYNLMSTVRARILAGIARDMYLKENSERKKAMSALLMIINTYRWYLVRSEDYIRDIWETLSQNDVLMPLIMNCVKDMKEEIIYNSDSTKGTDILWRQFCENLDEQFKIISGKTVHTELYTDIMDNDELEDFIPDETFNLSKCLEVHAWLALLMVLATVDVEQFIKAFSVETSNVGYANAGGSNE